MVLNSTTTIFLPRMIQNLSWLEVVCHYKKINEGKALEADPFDILYAFSIDKENYSSYKSKEDLEQEIHDLWISDFYISIKFFKKPTRTDNINTIYQKTNVIEDSYPIEIESIKYNDEEITDYESIDDEVEIRRRPLWNFYNHQDVTVIRWIAQCQAISEMYGHTCIYFKTTNTEVNKTLLHTHKREVVDIKKIMIMFPNNEIGAPDKVIYSDWDIPLAEDFIAHIVWESFQRAFGEDVIPDEKDYIYLPMLNKMFKIGTVQPINKFMGKIAWFECTLLKYENDEAVTINKDFNEVIPEFDEVLSEITKGNLLQVDGDEYVEREDDLTILQETQKHINDSLRTNQKIDTSTVIEKREVTDNYANKLVDSTQYISLRESEKYRQYYDSRLEIIQINPTSEMFPISMYDNRKIDKNVIALQYKTTDFTEISRNSVTPKESFKLSFNYVPTNKFSGHILSLLDNTGGVIICSLYTEREIYPKLKFRFDLIPNQNIKLIDYDFDLNELYNISITYIYRKEDDTTQIVLNIYKLVDNKKDNVFNDIMILDENLNIPPITYLHLYGGKFLSSEISLVVDNKQIFRDTCQPLLNMDNFEIR